MKPLARIPGESHEQFDRRETLHCLLREYNFQHLPNDDYDSFLSALSDTVEVLVAEAVKDALP